MTTREPRSTVGRLLVLLPSTIYLFVWAPAGSSHLAFTDVRFKRIATVVQEKMKEYGVPGVALGVSYRDLNEAQCLPRLTGKSCGVKRLISENRGEM